MSNKETPTTPRIRLHSVAILFGQLSMLISFAPTVWRTSDYKAYVKNTNTLQFGRFVRILASLSQKYVYSDLKEW